MHYQAFLTLIFFLISPSTLFLNIFPIFILMESIDDKSTIEALKIGEESFLRSFYYEHRPSFLQYAQKFPLNENDKIDAYQDAIVALKAHAIKGSLDNIQSSIKTYLFSICKYKIYNKLNKRASFKFEEFKENYQDQYSYEITIPNEEGLSVRQKLLKENFTLLGEKCQELLTLFYFRGLSIKEIATQMSYNSDNVVKSKKSQCLKKIRALIKSKHV